MVSTCLVACTLLAAQPAQAPLWLSAPRLSRGQEVLYRGSFIEETSKQKTKCVHKFQVENRILVLETLPTGSKIALLTVIQPELNNSAMKNQTAPSTCLTVAHLDPKGRLTNERGANLELPIGSLPQSEGGCFIEQPPADSQSHQQWFLSKPDLPRHYWRMTNTQSMDGQLCCKLIGNQQSEDWDHPSAGKIAWRRQDTVWVSPRTSLVIRYERIIEQREPTATDCSYRLTANFHLESSLTYPDQLFRDRQAEVVLHGQYSQLAEAALREPSLNSPRRLEALSAKIAYHCETQPPTPYRAALVELQSRLESASRGELPPIAQDSKTPAISNASSLTHSTAPDFVAKDLMSGSPVRLQLLRGQPVLMIFFNPSSSSASETLRFGQAVRQTNQAQVLGLSVAAGTDSIIKQCHDLRIDFPIIAGADLRSAYGVDATPRLIVIDGEGRTQRTFEGWGEETPVLIQEELLRCSQPTSKVGKGP